MLTLLISTMLSFPQQQCLTCVTGPATLVINAPNGSKVTIDGMELSSRTSPHIIETLPIIAGMRKKMSITVLAPDGTRREQTIQVTSGERKEVDFTTSATETNFGIDLGEFQASRYKVQRNGKEISIQEASDMLTNNLPDPQRPRLTIIGTEADRKEAMRLLKGPLAAAASEFIIRDYPPNHWAIARCGFVTDGQPTIYAQQADGTVLFRQNDLNGLELNLEVLRKPDGNYQPERDPDYRKGGKLENVLPLLAIGVAGLLLMLAFQRSKAD